MKNITSGPKLKNCKKSFAGRLLILLCIIGFGSDIFAGENNLRAMGEIHWSVPETESRVNLYQVAGNSAWMIENDSSNWMYYRAESENEWGSLRRKWDAEKTGYHRTGFAGQKQMDSTRAFYGEIWYDFDYRYKVNSAIEKEPYAIDPFVLADNTAGDFTYLGPELAARYSQKINDQWRWGIGLHYQINRGLKEIESECEIISRRIEASFDLVYKFDKHALGISFKPYQTQDITKLVTLSTGVEPTTKRYRGEFEYRERVGTSDRTAVHEGYELRPQYAYKSGAVENVSYLFYYYQWHEIFDGTTTRYYDGYFQGQHYGLQTVSRIKLGNSIYAFADYYLGVVDDWAKGPDRDLMFYRFNGLQHKFTAGGSKQLTEIPLLIAVEFGADYLLPDEKDYLAARHRDSAISNYFFKTGARFQLNNKFDLVAGFIYNTYYENREWNYYGNYNGVGLTAGGNYKFDRFEFEFSGKYQILNGTDNNYNSDQSRTRFDLFARLKQYF